MEKTVNCNIITLIKEVIGITNRDHCCEILAITAENEKIKLIFHRVVMTHVTGECGFIDRGLHLQRCEKSVSSVVQLENSKLIKQLEQQSRGAYSAEELKEFLVIDEDDAVIEVIAYDNPELMKI